MINGKQKIKLHQVLDLCIDITNNTKYDAQFGYSGHVEAFSVWIYKKGDKNFTRVYSRHVMTFNKYDQKTLDETTSDLIDFLNKKEVNA